MMAMESIQAKPEFTTGMANLEPTLAMTLTAKPRMMKGLFCFTIDDGTTVAIGARQNDGTNQFRPAFDARPTVTQTSVQSAQLVIRAVASTHLILQVESTPTPSPESHMH